MAPLPSLEIQKLFSQLGHLKSRVRELEELVSASSPVRRASVAVGRRPAASHLSRPDATCVTPEVPSAVPISLCELLQSPSGATGPCLAKVSLAGTDGLVVPRSPAKASYEADGDCLAIDGHKMAPSHAHDFSETPVAEPGRKHVEVDGDFLADLSNRFADLFMQEEDLLAAGEHVLATYTMKNKAGYNFLATATHFAAELSTGFNADTCPTDGLTKKTDAIVYYIDPEAEELKIAYPNILFDRNITDRQALVCSVLNMSVGNYQGMGDMEYGKIYDIYLPPMFLRLFDGPSCCINDVWRILRRGTFNGGLEVGTLIEPKPGLQLKAFGEAGNHQGMADVKYGKIQDIYFPFTFLSFLNGSSGALVNMRRILGRGTSHRSWAVGLVKKTELGLQAFWMGGDFIENGASPSDRVLSQMDGCIPEVAEAMRACIEKTGFARPISASSTADNLVLNDSAGAGDLITSSTEAAKADVLVGSATKGKLMGKDFCVSTTYVPVVDLTCELEAFRFDPGAQEFVPGKISHACADCLPAGPAQVDEELAKNLHGIEVFVNERRDFGMHSDRSDEARLAYRSGTRHGTLSFRPIKHARHTSAKTRGAFLDVPKAAHSLSTPGAESGDRSQALVAHFLDIDRALQSPRIMQEWAALLAAIDPQEMLSGSKNARAFNEDTWQSVFDPDSKEFEQYCMDVYFESLLDGS